MLNLIMTCFNRMAYHDSHDHGKSTLYATQIAAKRNERNHKFSMVACKGQVTESWKITTKLDHGEFALHVTFWSPVERKKQKGIVNNSLITNHNKEAKRYSN